MQIIESKQHPRSDRRAHERTGVREPVKIYDADTGRFITGETVDVSAGGLRGVVASLHRLSEGTRVEVAFGWSQGAIVPKRDMVSSIVVRSFPLGGSRQEIAVRFDKAIPGIALSAA